MRDTDFVIIWIFMLFVKKNIGRFLFFQYFSTLSLRFSQKHTQRQFVFQPKTKSARCTHIGRFLFCYTLALP